MSFSRESYMQAVDDIGLDAVSYVRSQIPKRLQTEDCTVVLLVLVPSPDEACSSVIASTQEVDKLTKLRDDLNLIIERFSQPSIPKTLQ